MYEKNPNFPKLKKITETYSVGYFPFENRNLYSKKVIIGGAIGPRRKRCRATSRNCPKRQLKNRGSD